MNTKLKYKINSYPKNKTVSETELSIEQFKLRNLSEKKYYYKESYLKKHGWKPGEERQKRCNKCEIIQPIEEFYYRKDTKTRRKTCRDCLIKDRGVVEIGKQRFSDEIFDKGFRRCSWCKQIKPLTAFCKNKSRSSGIANTCYKCLKKSVKKLQVNGRINLTDWYCKEYGKRKGIVKFNKKIIEQIRQEILENRKPKYFIDKKEFFTLRSFAEYILKVYKNPITMTEKRISSGKTEEDCKLSEKEMRSKYNGRNKGKIKVTDTITNEVFIFNNTKDKGLNKMFSNSSILRTIKTGNITRITKLSKYKNPCKIERI